MRLVRDAQSEMRCSWGRMFTLFPSGWQPQDRPYPQRCSRLNSPKEGAWAMGSELCEELMLVLPRDMDNGSCPRVPCAAPLSLL